MLLLYTLLFAFWSLRTASSAGSLTQVFRLVKNPPVFRFPSLEQQIDHGGSYDSDPGVTEDSMRGDLTVSVSGTTVSTGNPEGSQMSKTEESTSRDIPVFEPLTTVSTAAKSEGSQIGKTEDSTSGDIPDGSKMIKTGDSTNGDILTSGIWTTVSTTKPAGPQMSKTEITDYIMVLKKKFEDLGISLDNYFTDEAIKGETDEDDCIPEEPEKISKPETNVPAILTRLKQFISVDSPSEQPMGGDIQPANHQPDTHLVRNQADPVYQSDIELLKLEVLQFFKNNPLVEEMFKKDGQTTENSMFTTNVISTPLPDIVKSRLTGDTGYEIFAAQPDEPMSDFPYLDASIRYKTRRRRFRPSKRRYYRSRSKTSFVHTTRSKMIYKVRSSVRPRRRRKPSPWYRTRSSSRRMTRKKIARKNGEEKPELTRLMKNPEL